MAASGLSDIEHDRHRHAIGGADSGAPPPEPLAAEVIERFILCYPRIDAVRGCYREEVARLTQEHKEERNRLDEGLRQNYPPGKPGSIDAFWEIDRRKAALVRQPASTLVFAPVARDCGFDSVDDNAVALYAIIHHFPEKPDWLRPYLDRVAPMRVPNLE